MNKYLDKLIRAFALNSDIKHRTFPLQQDFKNKRIHELIATFNKNYTHLIMWLILQTYLIIL